MTKLNGEEEEMGLDITDVMEEIIIALNNLTDTIESLEAKIDDLRTGKKF